MQQTVPKLCALRDNYLLFLMCLGLTGLGWGSSSETDTLLSPPRGSRPILLWTAEMQEIMPNSTSAFQSFVVNPASVPWIKESHMGKPNEKGLESSIYLPNGRTEGNEYLLIVTESITSTSKIYMRYMRLHQNI